MKTYEDGGYGDGDFGSFDPIAAHLLDQISLAEGEDRAAALSAYNDYLATRDAPAPEEA